MALLDFLRVVFRRGRAANKIAHTLAGASATLMAKVPPQLTQLAVNIIEHGAPDSGSETDSEDEEQDGAGEAGAVERRMHRRDLAGQAWEVTESVWGDTGCATGEAMPRPPYCASAVASRTRRELRSG